MADAGGADAGGGNCGGRTYDGRAGARGIKWCAAAAAAAAYQVPAAHTGGDAMAGHGGACAPVKATGGGGIHHADGTAGVELAGAATYEGGPDGSRVTGAAQAGTGRSLQLGVPLMVAAGAKAARGRL